jgi:hypothetical protein
VLGFPLVDDLRGVCQHAFTAGQVDFTSTDILLAGEHLGLCCRYRPGVFGTIGIDPTRMIALPPFLVPQPAGIGSLTIPVPNQPFTSIDPISGDSRSSWASRRTTRSGFNA